MGDMAESKIKVEKYQQLKEGTDYTITFSDTNIDMTKDHKARVYQITENLFHMVVSATTKSTLALNAHSLKQIATIALTGKTIADGTNGVGSVYGGYANYLLLQGSLTITGAVRVVNPSAENYQGNLSFSLYIWFLAY